jgi:prepilin-type N-terminal cleavage/methylation domain-containing protein
MKSSRGFTLIEILVVISIIAILAGMTLGVGGPMMEKAKRSRTQGEIAAIESALERYKIDNGGYPISDSYPNIEVDGDPKQSNYIVTGEQLFQALCGRKNLKEKAESQVYYEVKQSQVDKESRISSTSNTYLVDPWGFAYGYCVNENDQGMNPGFFDLWSTSGKETIEDRKKWIGNWHSQ